MKKAISYIRFSTVAQGVKGRDSTIRQKRALEDALKKHNLELDQQFLDDGKSGYKQKHIKPGGAMYELLKLAKQGKLAGKVVVIEDWDRAGRLQVTVAAPLLLDMVNNGVDLVVGSNGGDYFSKEIIEKNSYVFYGALEAMKRGFEESKRKSEMAESKHRSRLEAVAKGQKVALNNYLHSLLVDGKLDENPTRLEMQEALRAVVDKITVDTVGKSYAVTFKNSESVFRVKFIVGKGKTGISGYKHVLISEQKREYFIRANLKGGGSTIIGLGDISWFNHPNEIRPSDVAVYPFALPIKDLKEIDFEAIPVSSFLSNETRVSEGIGEGDEVFTVGLFSRHTGNQRNLPIIRMGTIAMISDELVPTQKFGSIEAYLIEARSIKGLSGSPVFVLKQKGVRFGEIMVPSSVVSLHFLGLIHGHWDLSPGQSIDVEDSVGGQESVNMGIAIVIPANHILETLNQKALVEWRESQEASWISKNSPQSE